MQTLEREVATAALEQAREALRNIPDDATVNQRAHVVTTAVRALSAYRDAHDSKEVPPEQDAAESPA